ncbi:MAG: CRTAC1 family protein [Gammaproteobacteria bacterium]
MPRPLPSPRVCQLIGTGALLGLAACGPTEQQLTLFEKAPVDALAGNAGMTHGAAWGDLDADGLPDLYITNHLRNAQLFRNESGRLTEVTAEWLDADALGADKHGAAWADFNRDGRLDLVQLTGAVQGRGEEPKRLFVNDGTRLVDRAPAWGVDNPTARTRMPLWLDPDGDGKLDLLQGAEQRLDSSDPPRYFRQQDTAFIDASEALPFASRGFPFCVLTLLDDDHHPELVCRLKGDRALQVLSTAALPAGSPELLPQTAFEDAVAGDFDNDGAIDLFLARKNPGGRLALATGEGHSITAQAELPGAAPDLEVGFTFESTGTLTMTLAGQHTGELTAGDIRLGAEGRVPDALTLTLRPGDAEGLPRGSSSMRPVIAIGHDGDAWHVRFRAPRDKRPGGPAQLNLAARIISDAPLAGLTALEGSSQDEAAPQRLYMNRHGAFVDEGADRGLEDLLLAVVNAVGGDFDNDGDLDLFLLCSGDAGKRPNVLLLNDGTGDFTPVTAAGGAAGTLHGVGDSVTTADIDGDGFLDLLTASGGSMGRSLGLPSDDGRYELFRNVGNGNHWLMIDLVGTRSNAHGIGARVTVTAGGHSQVRVQDGGIHERGQNHMRLHFGLRDSTVADRVSVTWPTGIVQELTKLPTNQVLTIEEPR